MAHTYAKHMSAATAAAGPDDEPPARYFGDSTLSNELNGVSVAPYAECTPYDLMFKGLVWIRSYRVRGFPSISLPHAELIHVALANIDHASVLEGNKRCRFNG